MIDLQLSDKAIRFMLIAIETERRRLEAIEKTSARADRVCAT